MNTKGYVLTGQQRCMDASEAIAVMAEWLALDGDARIFANRQNGETWLEMWRRER